MSFRLTVDGQRWNQQLAQVAGRSPGLVPVITDNGYGFGAARLAQRCTALALDTVAVGTMAGVGAVRPYFAGAILVTDPMTGAADQPSGGGVIRTVATAGVVERLAGQGMRTPIVLELGSPEHRRGIPAEVVRELAPALRRLSLAGVTLARPDTAGRDERDDLSRQQIVARTLAAVTALRRAGVETGALWTSHLDAAERAALQRQVPWVRLRVRQGASLWLGDPEAFAASGTVLDRRELPGRNRSGRQRIGHRRNAEGTVVVVSGGVAHGVGAVADVPGGSWRGLLRTALAGPGARAGDSPFRWQGQRLSYAGLPRPEVSMLLVPPGVQAPQIGQRLPCDVTMTGASFDEVDLQDRPLARPSEASSPMTAA